MNESTGKADEKTNFKTARIERVENGWVLTDIPDQSVIFERTGGRYVFNTPKKLAEFIEENFHLARPA